MRLDEMVMAFAIFSVGVMALAFSALLLVETWARL